MTKSKRKPEAILPWMKEHTFLVYDCLKRYCAVEARNRVEALEKARHESPGQRLTHAIKRCDCGCKLHAIPRFVHDDRHNIHDVVWEVDDETEVVSRWCTEEDANADIRERERDDRAAARCA